MAVTLLRGRRGALIAAAAIVGAVVGVYVSLGIHGKDEAGVAAVCSDTPAVAARVAPRVTGDVAAFRVADRPEPLTEIAFKDPAGNDISLSDFVGKTMLVNLWATWCVPCVQEMPTLQKLYEAYADSGLAVVAISIDDPGSEDLIREFRRQHGLTFEILHDPSTAIMDLLPRFAVPQTLVIDRRGRVRATRYGDDWFSAANRDLVRRLLAE